MARIDRLQKNILKSVSRSFYLSIRLLPESIRPLISLGYLLCRAADTVADTPGSPLAERLKTLQNFKTLFSSFPLEMERVRDFLRDQAQWPRYFEDCAEWFNSFSKTDQALIQNVVLAVLQGMEFDLQSFGDSADTLRAFPSEKDLATYIHWIGGEPGRFWTDACLAHMPELKIENRDRWLKDGIIFGTGLQMVNILRDLPADLKNGRCYIPADALAEHGLVPADLLDGKKQDVFLTLYHQWVDQTAVRLKHALPYLEQMEAAPLGLRMAVWMPMTIGLKTLERLRSNNFILTAEKPVKIKRWEVYWLLIRAAGTCFTPSCIERRIRREAIRN